MQKRVSLLTLIVSVALAIFVTFTITFAVVQAANHIYDLVDESNNPTSEINEWQAALPDEKRNPELFETLAMLDYYYQTGYVNDVDEEALISRLMNAYIICVGDPYGVYYTPEEVEAVYNDTVGVNVGIGVYVRIMSEDDQRIKILEVMDGSPAKSAGILKGDIITHIEGVDVSEIGYDAAVDMIAGAVDTYVNITVLRGDVIKTISVKRNVYTMQTVFYHKYALDPSVGVVLITEFNDGTPSQFKTAVNTLLNQGCKSLVFDVRSNPGGTVDSCVEILDFLLPSGEIAYVTDLDGTVVETYYSDVGCIDVPMAVLTNGTTASGAELFTCALKDYGKALVVGTTTYGKGCMQSIINLPNGGALRYTTHLYNPPTSGNYDGVGITPNIEVELDSSLEKINHFEITDEMDNQLKVAYEAINPKQ